MMQDVSGISTPMGTPRAATRDLEGSLAGSVRGGSVADIDDLGSRLEGLDTSSQGRGEAGESVKGGSEAGDSTRAPEGQDTEVDEASTPAAEEPTKDDLTTDDAKPSDDDETAKESTESNADPKDETTNEPTSEKLIDDNEVRHNPQGVLQNPDANIEYTVNNEDQDDKDKPKAENLSKDRDPNLDDDLDDLKAGNLGHSSSNEVDTTKLDKGKDPVNNLAESSFTQGLAEYQMDVHETKHQGGVAGQRMQDVENADEIVQPDEADPPPSKGEGNDGGPEVRDATPSQDEGTATATVDDESLGPRGALDGPQKFEVEWLETGRGQEKAAELDKKEYHFHGQDQGQGDKEGESGEAAKDEGKNDDRPDVPPSAHAAEATDTDQTNAKAEPVSDDTPVEAKGESKSESKPMQIQIEPAPIAQPASPSDEDSTSLTIPDTSDEQTPSVEINPPTFPAPPSEDPDVVDPISQAQSGATTPLDPAIARSFPDVPDESKPRVQVHVSSPLNTPQKERPQETFETATNATPVGVADLPGKSKSLSTTSLSLSAEGGDEASGSEAERAPGGGGHKRRLSARKSPKSPLLGDEDPGDFEPGEGWAVVTK